MIIVAFTNKTKVFSIFHYYMYYIFCLSLLLMFIISFQNIS